MSPLGLGVRAKFLMTARACCAACFVRAPSAKLLPSLGHERQHPPQLAAQCTAIAPPSLRSSLLCRSCPPLRKMHKPSNQVWGFTIHKSSPVQARLRQLYLDQRHPHRHRVTVWHLFSLVSDCHGPGPPAAGSQAFCCLACCQHSVPPAGGTHISCPTAVCCMTELETVLLAVQC